jgi:NADPH:quinone reductase-like Zn-dependent oxidoreductase
MKAAVIHKYGPADVVAIEEVEKPTPKANQILVRVAATAVNASDSRIRGAKFPKGFAPFARLAFGITKPRKKVLGSCFSGVVESAGSDVTEFADGDEVCGMSGLSMGAHAEFVLVNAKKAVVKKPENVSHEDAAGIVFGGTTALYFLRDKAHLQEGQSILINGASGAIGTNAIQIAKNFGAHVTALTSSKNAELARSLGADDVIAYDQENVNDTDKKFDAILDAVGNISISDGQKLLKDNGKLLMAVATLGQMLSFNKFAVSGTSPEKKANVEQLIQMLSEGKLKAVVSESLPLSDIAKAYEIVDSGRKVGNIVLTP